MATQTNNIEINLRCPVLDIDIFRPGSSGSFSLAGSGRGNPRTIVTNVSKPDRNQQPIQG